MPRALRVVLLAACCLSTVFIVRASLPKVLTGQWTPALDLSDARDNAAAALLANGDTLIAGGSNSAGALQTADVYHTDGSITVGAGMATARSRHTLTVLKDGRVLAAGGDSGGGAVTNSAEIYDPDTNTWSFAGSLATARLGHTATLLNDGRVAIIGGENNGAPVATIEIFDPAGNSFTQPAGLQTARKSHAAALLADGRVIVAGGLGPDGAALASAEIFDPASNSVTAAAAMNAARAGHSATAVLDGLVVVAGGSNGQADLNSIETYTPATNTWTVASATLSIARSGHIATLLPKNNSVLISGGISSGSAIQNAEIYQPWSGAVVSAGTMNSAHVLGAGSAFGVEGLYLAAGGSGGMSTEFFRFATIKTDLPDYSPGQTVLMTGTGFQPNETVVLNLKQDDGDADINTSVQADAAGNVSYQGFAPDPGDIGTHFHLTAIGQSSGFQAQTVFTDGNITVSGTVRSSVTGNPVIAGASVTCDTTSGCNAVITVTTDASGNYSFSGANKLSFGGNGPTTLTLKASATGFNSGSINLTNVSNGNTFTTQNFTLTPSTQTTTTSVSSSANPSVFGQNVTFTATVSPQIGGVPTGTVTFKDGTTTLGTGGLNSAAQATFSTSSLNVASHSITAVYGGDINYFGSTSAAFTQVVNKASQTISFAPLAGKNYGDADFAVSATASSGLTVSLSSQTASVCALASSTVHLLGAGTCTIRASQPGNINFSAATNVDQSFTVSPASVTATVTANNKIYDGGTSATQNTCSLTGVLPADSGNVTCSATTLSFADKNVAIGKAVTVSGISLSGSAAANYSLTSTTGTTSANITARPLTITASTNSKTYDGGVTAAALPAITVGALQGTDTANFDETYDTKNIGSGKILTPSGSVNDGNGGNNYSYTFVNDSTGVITARPITVSAVANTRQYDGTTSAAAAPSITAGALQGADVVNFTETYDNKHAGSGKTLAPSGVVNDGNGGNNYAYTFVNNSAGVITQRPITVTAAVNTKVYDGTVSAAAIPNVTTGSLAAGDSGAFTESYDTRHVGTAKTLTTSGTVKDSGSADVGSDYAITFLSASTGVISARPVTVTAATDAKTFDGTTVSSGVPGVTIGSLVAGDAGSFTQVFDTVNAGARTLIPSGSVSDGNGGNDYALTFVAVSGTINKATPLVSVTGGTFTYDGGSHPATFTVTGVGGAAVSGSAAVTYNGLAALPANAGNYAVVVAFTSGDSNYNDANGNSSILINKASSTTLVSVAGGLTFTYDGAAHPATVAVTGAGGLSLTPDPVYSCGHAPINVADTGCSASYSFAGDENHNPSSDSKTYAINQATPLVTISGGPFTFDGSSHPATLSVTGVGGAAVSGSAAITYNGVATVPANAGTYAVAVNFTSADNNYDNAAGSGSILINKALSVTAISGVFSFTFDGNAHPATASVTGAGGLNLTPDPVYSCGHAPLNVADSGCTASYNFAGDDNHTASSDSRTYTINKATPLVTVSGGPFTFDGNSHTVAVTASGVGGAAVIGSLGVTYNGSGTMPVNAGTYAVVANFTSTDNNYSNASGSGSLTIDQAPSVTTVSGMFSFIYDDNPRPATVTVTGAGGLSLAPAPAYSCGHVPMIVGDSGCIASYNYPGDINHTGSSDSRTYTIGKAMPVLTINSLAVTIGNPVTISGSVKLNSLVPTGTVTLTVNGISQVSAVGAGGVYSTTYAAGTLDVGGYGVTAVYSGDGNFFGVSNTGSVNFSIQYNVCYLYDQTKAVQHNATVPIKIQLCDAAGHNLSSSAIMVTALNVALISGASGTLEDSGNANPDDNFRYDPTLPGYIFNLSTKPLVSGTWQMYFRTSKDAGTGSPYTAGFGVK